MPQNTIANQYYEAERILEEKIMGEEKFYKIKWKGMDHNKRPWEPTWVFIKKKNYSFLLFFKKIYIYIKIFFVGTCKSLYTTAYRFLGTTT